MGLALPLRGRGAAKAGETAVGKTCGAVTASPRAGGKKNSQPHADGPAAGCEHFSGAREGKGKRRGAKRANNDGHTDRHLRLYCIDTVDRFKSQSRR